MEHDVSIFIREISSLKINWEIFSAVQLRFYLKIQLNLFIFFCFLNQQQNISLEINFPEKQAHCIFLLNFVSGRARDFRRIYWLKKSLFFQFRLRRKIFIISSNLKLSLCLPLLINNK
jgi:hypothetical protein